MTREHLKLLRSSIGYTTTLKSKGGKMWKQCFKCKEWTPATFRGDPICWKHLKELTELAKRNNKKKLSEIVKTNTDEKTTSKNAI